MDPILQVFLFWLLDEHHARVCPSELRLSPSRLGCCPEVLVQFHCYYAPRQGNVTRVPLGFSAFSALVPATDRFLQLLGVATDQLSLKLGQTLSGLLNASFGNAVEIIVGVAALLQGIVPRFASSPLLLRFFVRNRVADATPNHPGQLRIVQTSVSRSRAARGRVTVRLTVTFYSVTRFHSLQLASRFGMLFLGWWFEVP